MRAAIPMTAGVCLVRDAIDMIPYLCGHYLRLGFERLIFIDDSSSDGTYELLEAFARKTSRLEVRRSFNQQLEQKSLVTQAVNDCIEAGARLIFPFDADEFWHLTRAGLREMATREEPRIITGKWRNFVQRRERTHPQFLGHLSATHRAEPTTNIRVKDVYGFKEPFVALSMDKVAFWTDQPVELDLGQHALHGSPLSADTKELEIFHLPIRWKSELTKRGLNYEPRRATKRRAVDQSWQSKFHGEIVRANQVDAVWAANSSDQQGNLDVYGTPRALVHDTRLRTLLIRAATHAAALRWRRDTGSVVGVLIDKARLPAENLARQDSLGPLAYVDQVVLQGDNSSLRGWAVMPSGLPAAEFAIRLGNGIEIRPPALVLTRIDRHDVVAAHSWAVAECGFDIAIPAGVLRLHGIDALNEISLCVREDPDSEFIELRGDAFPSLHDALHKAMTPLPAIPDTPT